MNFQISALAIGIGQGYQNQMATIGLESQVSMFERLKYEEKIRDLKKEFEAALKVQKKEREEECKRLLEELKVCLYIFIHIYLHRYIVYFCMFFLFLLKEREEQIAHLNDQLKGDDDNKVKMMKLEVQQVWLKKFNNELKCTICDDLFVMVSK